MISLDIFRGGAPTLLSKRGGFPAAKTNTQKPRELVLCPLVYLKLYMNQEEP